MVILTFSWRVGLRVDRNHDWFRTDRSSVAIVIVRIVLAVCKTNDGKSVKSMYLIPWSNNKITMPVYFINDFISSLTKTEKGIFQLVKKSRQLDIHMRQAFTYSHTIHEKKERTFCLETSVTKVVWTFTTYVIHHYE